MDLLPLPWLTDNCADDRRHRLMRWVMPLVLLGGVHALGQAAVSHQVRAGRFLAGRPASDGGAGAAELDRARREHLAVLAQSAVQNALLSAPWTSVGPGQVATAAYGPVNGRVTSIAIDPGDATGNTVYLGTTGGGVWRSTNAAGPAGSVQFQPLTDTIVAFNPNAGTSAIPSLSIGAVSVQPGFSTGVVLAGTGDPNDATDSYYGVGVLRSSDGGNTWTLVQQSTDGAAGNHAFFGLGFAGFAWSTTTSGLVVAAVSDAAEGTLVNAPGTTSVRGLYYSADAGATWQMATIMDGGQTVQQPLPGGANGPGNAATAVVWNAERQMFIAAVRFHGYYQSADGVMWSRMAQQPGAGLTTAACPPDPSTTGNVGCPIFRGALAVAPATGDTFAFTVDVNHGDQGIWQDVCGFTGTSCASPQVSFGTQLNAAPLETAGAIPQGDYNLALGAVESGTDTLVFAGTVDLYRCSLASGCTFRNTTNTEDGCSSPAMVAPAQHAIATLAGGGGLVYLGNDGGLWRSTDGVAEQGSVCATTDASHFENLNPALGSLAEVVSFAADPTNPDTLLAGLGANGTAATSTASTQPLWRQLAAAEGGYVAIDQVTPANWYISDGPGVSVSYCGAGAACTAADFTAGSPTVGSAQVEGDTSVVDAPWMLDPALPTNVQVGTCRGWRGPSQDGAAWTAADGLSTDFGTTQDAVCGTGSALARSVGLGGPASATGALGVQGSTVLYAGIAGALDGGGGYAGHLFETAAGQMASGTMPWSDVAISPVVNDVANGGVFNPGGFDVSSVVADPHDATGGTVYATVMGFGVTPGTSAPHLYRSTDAGAHWTNISGNLPGAPANAVLVDPNDANTVYVALDTGVYVTSTVTSCATGNCWSVYGASLPNAPVVGLAAEALMPTGDGRLGELRASTYGRGIWQIPLLTAATIARPVMTLSPTALSFGTVQVATASAAQTITVVNTGTAPLTVSSVTASGDFTESDTCVGTSVAVAGSCAVAVVFQPTATGARGGVLTVFGNVAGGQATAALTGTGAPAASVTLTPLRLSYTQTDVGATSAQQNIVVANLGGVTTTLGTPTATGDFKIANNTCATTLLANASCSVVVVFAPTAAGTRTGQFAVTDSAGTQTAALIGIGTAPATDLLGPVSLSFAAQQLTTASLSQAITLTNSGDDALTLIAASVSSAGFTVINGCGNSLSGHSSCTLNVQFVPQALGQQVGTLRVSDQFRAQTVALAGVGIAPPGVSLAPIGTLGFPLTAVGGVSSPQAVTLTNNGGVPLVISGFAFNGDFQAAATGSTCGTTLAIGAACVEEIIFAPTTAGPGSGTLTVTDNAGSSPQRIALAGVGLAFALTADGGTTVTVSSGASAVFPLLLSSAAGLPGTASFTCSGAPQNSTCVVTPGSAPLGGTTTLSVTIETGVATSTAQATHQPSLVWFSLLLPAGLMLRRRRWGMWLAAALLLSGCGAGRAIPPATTATPVVAGAATPSGTYPIKVSATSAGLTESIGLTLIVQ